MSEKQTTEEIKAKELQEFLEIRDFQDKVVYTTTSKELDEVLTSILTTGVYTKTFDLFNGKISITFQSITEEERMAGYHFINDFTNKEKDKLSRIEYDSYVAKVNIALQLVRTTINGATSNISQGTISDRMMLLVKTPEDQIRLYSKYLSIFANITAKAFSSEELLKNS